jgi:hypothetical protein
MAAPFSLALSGSRLAGDVCMPQGPRKRWLRREKHTVHQAKGTRNTYLNAVCSSETHTRRKSQ